MEIFINQEKADIQLEGEKTAAQVVESLTAWGEAQNFMIYDRRIDGMVPSDEELKTLSLDKIQRFEVRMAPPAEVAYRLLGDLKDYLARIRVALQEARPGATKEILDAPAWMRQALVTTAKTLGMESEIPPVEKTLKDFEIALFKRDRAEKTESSENLLNQHLGDLEERIGSLFHRAYFRNLRLLTGSLDLSNASEFLSTESKRLFDLTSELLPAAGEAIHKGRDRAAMEKVNLLTEGAQAVLFFAAKCESFLAALGKNKPSDFDPAIELFREKLQEVEGALKSSDMILLGDLLEYEIAELLPRLSTAICDAATLISK